MSDRLSPVDLCQIIVPLEFKPLKFLWNGFAFLFYSLFNLLLYRHRKNARGFRFKWCNTNRLVGNWVSTWNEPHRCLQGEIKKCLFIWASLALLYSGHRQAHCRLIFTIFMKKSFLVCRQFHSSPQAMNVCRIIASIRATARIMFQKIFHDTSRLWFADRYIRAPKQWTFAES